MKERLETLAEMVLDMRARQSELGRLTHLAKYTRSVVDPERIAELDYELRELQREVEDECKDILGIEEE